MKMAMNRFFTLLLAASCLTAVGQVEFPWNPDTNDDGIVGAEDLLGLLSVYNGEWELPDPTLWATSTINALLELEAELDSVADYLAQSQAAIDSSLIELTSLQDNISMVTSFNTYTQTNSRCFIDIPDYNYVSSHVHFDITNSCGCVVVKTAYGQTWSDPSTRAKIRLPQEGLFEGQRIFVRMIADYSDGAPQQIEQFVNGSWQYLVTLQEHFPTSGASNFSSSMSNKTFIWNGESWTVSSGGASISATFD